ncbi:hypothetical protein [Mediterraneibacter gnavus]|uniref:hypothetical protein n=1 Tax=Mediterraneibacter gnavus TaxID=33038 RepID=UPI0036D3AC6C
MENGVAKTLISRAKEKLEKELNDAKDKNFADPVIKYLLKRCEEDDGLSSDVLQPHKHGRNVLLISMSRQENRGMEIVRRSLMMWSMNGRKTISIWMIRLLRKRRKKRRRNGKNSRSRMLRSVSNRSPNRSLQKKRNRKDT